MERGAAGAEDALVHAAELGGLGLGDLLIIRLWRILALQPRLASLLLDEQVGHVIVEILDDEYVRERRDRGCSRRLRFDLGEAGEPVVAVNVQDADACPARS